MKPIKVFTCVIIVELEQDVFKEALRTLLNAHDGFFWGKFAKTLSWIYGRELNISQNIS